MKKDKYKRGNKYNIRVDIKNNQVQISGCILLLLILVLVIVTGVNLRFHSLTDTLFEVKSNNNALEKTPSRLGGKI